MWILHLIKKLLFLGLHSSNSPGENFQAGNKCHEHDFEGQAGKPPKTPDSLARGYLHLAPGTVVPATM